MNAVYDVAILTGCIAVSCVHTHHIHHSRRTSRVHFGSRTVRIVPHLGPRTVRIGKPSFKERGISWRGRLRPLHSYRFRALIRT